ncbi:hypothetical protein D9M71_553280 [compost metagenome]
MARTASLTVAPGTRLLICFTTPRSRVTESQTRLDVTLLLKRVRGAPPSALSTELATLRRLAMASFGSTRASGSAMRAEAVMLSVSMRFTVSSMPQRCATRDAAGVLSTTATGLPCAPARSCKAQVSSAAAAPSIAAWCDLVRMAKLPLGMPSMLSSPSITYISQGARERSTERAWIRDTRMQNWRQSPGLGRAKWRTWKSMSNRSSSTQ